MYNKLLMSCTTVVPYSWAAASGCNAWWASSTWWAPTCGTVSSWKPDPWTRVTQRVTNWSGASVVPAWSYSRSWCRSPCYTWSW